mmetsp:Transcript_19496/g.54190  ORF Transcript_19496/g.54190 Transcript_19496/m.54190 type:complete len:286 (+) Transcript_19496:333-1190(+)
MVDFHTNWARVHWRQLEIVLSMISFVIRSFPSYFPSFIHSLSHYLQQSLPRATRWVDHHSSYPYRSAAWHDTARMQIGNQEHLCTHALTYPLMHPLMYSCILARTSSSSCHSQGDLHQSTQVIRIRREVFAMHHVDALLIAITCEGMIQRRLVLASRIRPRVHRTESMIIHGVAYLFEVIGGPRVEIARKDGRQAVSQLFIVFVHRLQHRDHVRYQLLRIAERLPIVSMEADEADLLSIVGGSLRMRSGVRSFCLRGGTAHGVGRGQRRGDDGFLHDEATELGVW